MVPSNTFPDILIHLGEFGLQVSQQSVQQLRNSPLLLGQTSLKHVQQTDREKRWGGGKEGERGKASCYCSISVHRVSAGVTTAAGIQQVQKYSGRQTQPLNI